MANYGFYVTVGAFIRGRIKQEIQGFCFMRGLSCGVLENKGLLESTYYFRVEGNAADVLELREFVRVLPAKEATER